MRLENARKLVGEEAIVHPHYDPQIRSRKIESVKNSTGYPDQLVFNLSGIEGGILEKFVWCSSWDRQDAPQWVPESYGESKNEEKLTAPQISLLSELDISKLLKKAGINKQPPMKEFPQRSGNLETPVKQKHKGLMGQPNNPSGTMADKPGREQAKHIHAEPTSMEDPSGLENLGEPLARGISDENIGDDANLHPSSKKYKPVRLQGPSETPGKQTWTSFGNRYPGAKNF